MIPILAKQASARTKTELAQIEPMIKNIKFFSDREIESDSYSLLANALQYEFGKRGEIVFEKGSIGDKFYIILIGEVGKHSFLIIHNINLKYFRYLCAETEKGNHFENGNYVEE